MIQIANKINLKRSASLAFLVLASACTSPTKVVITSVGSQNSDAIQKLKASLIVQGANCVLCHATINSNLVTDFGSTNPNPVFQQIINQKGPQYAAPGAPFFGEGGDESGLKPLGTGTAQNYRTPYNNANLGWNAPVGYSNGGQSLPAVNIQGSVIVPQVQISPTVAQNTFGISSSTPITFPMIFATNDPAYQSATGNSGNMLTALHPPAINGVIPPAILESKDLQIQYPTAHSFDLYLPLVDAVPGKFGLIGYTAPNFFVSNDPTKFSGLIQSSSKKYITNDPQNPLICYGDVVVDGVLFLNNLNLVTDQNGCRIYTTKTVFIQGAVTYSANASAANLQIASGLGIAMGFNHDSLSKRLNWYSAQTDPLSLGKQADYNAMIADASLVGSSLQDVSAVTHSPTWVEITTPAPAAAIIPFSGLLLAAPYIESHYYGNFAGVIVADIAVGQLGNFSFSYDSRFDQVPSLLPLMLNPLVILDPNLKLGAK